MNTRLPEILAVSVMCIAGLAGCDEGGAEEAGEEIDEAVEEVGDEIEDLTDKKH